MFASSIHPFITSAVHGDAAGRREMISGEIMYAWKRLSSSDSCSLTDPN
jgi:hypothetical protein